MKQTTQKIRFCEAGRLGRFRVMALVLTLMVFAATIVSCQNQPGSATTTAHTPQSTPVKGGPSVSMTVSPSPMSRPQATALSTGTEPTRSVVTSVSATTPATAPMAADATATVIGVGDILLHQEVIDGGAKADGTFDFSPGFAYVRPIIQAADLACANFENTLDGAPYSGYPRFRSPDEIARDLAGSGFDIAWFANNHVIDGGKAGYTRTIQTLRKYGLRVLGSKLTEQERTDAVVAAGDIRFGMLAWTYETTIGMGEKTLNGIPVPPELAPLIDSFRQNEAVQLERDLARMGSRIQALRGEGAELIVLSIHWGSEYQTASNDFQRRLAQKLADLGIDVIFGHHPHVLQEVAVLTRKDGGLTGVFYSISNFYHNMLFNTHNTGGYAQDAMIARIVAERRQGKARIVRLEYVPTYVMRSPENGKIRHRIVPLLTAQSNPAAYSTTRELVQASLTRINKVMAANKPHPNLPIVQVVK